MDNGGSKIWCGLWGRGKEKIEAVSVVVALSSFLA